MFGLGGLLGGGGAQPRAGSSFDIELRCFSMSVLGKSNYDKGGKIVLPESALQTLSGMVVQYPMVFRLSNGASGRSTHCGVIEFCAEEGHVHLPYWMMENLGLAEGQIVQVKNTSLPKGEYVKLQPQSVDFLDLTNPKAVLEMQLREFSCLTKGDIIRVTYLDRNYDIAILETKPNEAISIVEADVNVDFAAPVGYVDPSTQNGGGSASAAGGGGSSSSKPGKMIAGVHAGDDDDDIFRVRKSSRKTSGDGSDGDSDGDSSDDDEDDDEDDDSDGDGGSKGKDKAKSNNGFVAFGGTGVSVSGKKVAIEGVPVAKDGRPPVGTGYSAARELAAERNARAAKAKEEEKKSAGKSAGGSSFQAFSGSGNSLK